jgi:hypothetical protein
MISPHDPAGWRQPAVDTQRQLQQIADLVDEYAETALATVNGDLMILLFQIRMVLGDDPAEAGRRISRTPTPPA